MMQSAQIDARRSSRMWTMVCAGLSLTVMGRAATAVEVRATKIDGSTVTAQWVGLVDERHIKLSREDGALSIPLGDLAEVAFPQAGTSRNTHGPVVFHLQDGGRINGRFVGGGKDRVVGDSMIADGLVLPFGQLAAIELASAPEFPRAAELFRSALGDRLAGQDILVTRSVDEPQALPGRLQQVGPERGVFVFGGRERPFQTDRMYGIVFAVGIARVEEFDTTIELPDGSLLAGRVEGANERTLTYRTSLGEPLELPLSHIARIRVQSGRVVFLSDLTPQEERVAGLLHRPWPVRADRSVAARPMQIGGRRFEKGIGCHSLTELVYSIDGAYDSFVATIGIDDSVRPRGAVVFRVRGDERVLFDSGPVTGTDDPRQIVVDVREVKELTLVVDYGPGLDVSDHADWGDARLLRRRDAAETDRTIQ
jgi:hypothetical protein